MTIFTPPTAITPAKAGNRLLHPEPGTRFRGDDDKGRADGAEKVARQFEALFVAQMLKSARAAALVSDPLTGQGGATFSGMIDDARAQALSEQAPLGVARLLAK